jgi:hypothetical protein
MSMQEVHALLSKNVYVYVSFKKNKRKKMKIKKTIK